jgi:hypothetical protein
MQKGFVLIRPGYCLALIFILLFFVSGCESMRDTWDSTQEFYKNYINVDPEIDLEVEDLDPAEYKLARIFTPIDTRIEQVSRRLDATDSFPGEKWFDELFAQNPWISGVMVTDLQGEILHKQPETAMKPLTVEPLLEEPDELWDRRVRAMVQDTELGPEIYMATPFFTEAELSGIVAVHFDIRNLVEFSPNPDELIILSPGLMLWPGNYDDGVLMQEPWDEILADDVTGEIESGGKEFVWVSRFVGDKKIVYAVEKPAED